MVLFKYIRYMFSSKGCLIYIPLWSYSNESRGEIMDIEKCIYIPLWSYSNLKLHNLNFELIYLHSTMVLFKFSSESINQVGCSYLHSTMVLFKFITQILFLLSNKIYIPLWSYSNKNYRNFAKKGQYIYIPLWSYSNIITQILFLLSNKIYIPLWSYSNPLLLQYNNSLIKATTFVNPQHFHLDNSFFS